MKPISKFIFSICFLFVVLLSEAQENKKDSLVVKTNRYGLRVGIDLYKISRNFLEKEYKGFEFVGDYRISKKHYLAGELGNENNTVVDDRVNFTTKGSYFKVGFDYNLYDNWGDMENKVFVGMRYGVSSFSQRLNSYKIYNANPYFENTPEIISGAQFDGLSAQWFEIVAGINAKVINNFYVGFSFRINTLVSNKKPDTFDNLYIPGFNRTYDGNFGVGFNYTVGYYLPLYKKKISYLKIQKKESTKN